MSDFAANVMGLSAGLCIVALIGTMVFMGVAATIYNMNSPRQVIELPEPKTECIQ